jgi:tetratricopeptide (TPR) repeat protein
MEPLFEQVYHGCAAELYDEAFSDVYWNKIYRGKEYFLTQELGAWETALSLTRNFFPEGDLSQIPYVKREGAQSLLLNSAWLILLYTSRPREAERPLLLSAEISEGLKDWSEVSIRYQNLADLQFRMGEIEKGLESAKRAHEAAERVGSDKNIAKSKSYIAWILHLLGKDRETEKEFKEADELQREIDPDRNRLHSLVGVFYSDFLISTKRVDEADELVKKNLEICRRRNWVANISRCHRCLAVIRRIKGDYKEALSHLQTSLELSRKVGIPFLEIEALIEYGKLYIRKAEYEYAITAANIALKACKKQAFCSMSLMQRW